MDRFDVIVIGGGPAGMMAACQAAARGAKVLLLEKNEHLGKKLELTGRGRCNLTHEGADVDVLAQRYGEGKDFMAQCMRRFGPKETLDFFLSRGLDIVLERGDRYFPAKGRDAQSVTALLKRELRQRRVLTLTKTEVKGLDMLSGKVKRVITAKGEVEGHQFIIATGGLSFPQTGCSGDGYRFARKAGLEVQEPQPALCPIRLTDHLPRELVALRLKNVRLTASCNNEIIAERFGELDFAPFGLSGAIAMDMAAAVGKALNNGTVTLSIDLKPALDDAKLDARIGRDFEQSPNLPLRFALGKLLPRDLIGLVISRLAIDETTPVSQIDQEGRVKLRKILKDLSFTVAELIGFRHAIITAGGVCLDDLNPETCGCSGVPNLYFAGEVIDLDGPSGGFNLQVCWTTGAIAGIAAAAALGKTQVINVNDPVEPGKIVDMRSEEKEPQGRRPFGNAAHRRPFDRKPDRSTGFSNRKTQGEHNKRTPSDRQRSRPFQRNEGQETSHRAPRRPQRSKE